MVTKKIILTVLVVMGMFGAFSAHAMGIRWGKSTKEKLQKQLLEYERDLKELDRRYSDLVDRMTDLMRKHGARKTSNEQVRLLGKKRKLQLEIDQIKEKLSKMED